ncbi:hypothetical protein [Burkholderia glumae]
MTRLCHDCRFRIGRDLVELSFQKAGVRKAIRKIEITMSAPTAERFPDTGESRGPALVRFMPAQAVQASGAPSDASPAIKLAAHGGSSLSRQRAAWNAASDIRAGRNNRDNYRHIKIDNRFIQIPIKINLHIFQADVIRCPHRAPAALKMKRLLQRHRATKSAQCATAQIIKTRDSLPCPL